uniref:Salivary gland protein 6 n=1 Tax=Anopheles culicifacies TaxID=139723 RepID=A0A2C9GUH8_9DIPT
MSKFVELLALTVLLPILFHYSTAEKVWVDRDKVYCSHIDCRYDATYKGERFCTLCDTQHFCECKEIKESLPYMYACPGSEPCKTSDRRGNCQKTMDDKLCSQIDKPFLE